MQHNAVTVSLVVTLHKYFSNPSSVVYFFPTLPIKLTNTTTANSWEIINSKPPGLAIRIGSGSQIIFLTLFSGRLLGSTVPIMSSFFLGAKFALGSIKRTP
jgi:hypothetical protein